MSVNECNASLDKDNDCYSCTCPYCGNTVLLTQISEEENNILQNYGVIEYWCDTCSKELLVYGIPIMDTSNYINIKMVNARPMTKGRAYSENIHKGSIVDGEENEKGYIVLCIDGNTSWVAKDIFEQSHFKLDYDTHITDADIERFLNKEQSNRIGINTVITTNTTISGFDVNAVRSSSDTDDYIVYKAHDDCRNEIKNKIRSYLGFILQWANNGLKR